MLKDSRPQAWKCVETDAAGHEKWGGAEAGQVIYVPLCFLKQSAQPEKKGRRKNLKTTWREPLLRGQWLLIDGTNCCEGETFLSSLEEREGHRLQRRNSRLTEQGWVAETVATPATSKAPTSARNSRRSSTCFSPKAGRLPQTYFAVQKWRVERSRA
ncbi:hypothetical protein VTK26DRAFT_1956 [Humicola hyalothermophila]